MLAGAVFAFRASGTALLLDSDTIGILAGLEAKPNPWVWFTGDWPLGNHFYRPFPSLVFALDQALHPGSNAGFGATNAILVSLCVALVYWVVWEIWQHSGWALTGTALFAAWCLDFGFRIPSTWLCAACVAGLALLGAKTRLTWTEVAGMSAGCALFWFELAGLNPLYFRTLGWLPGRTATVMTVFCLVAMAAYLRTLRTGSLWWMTSCLLATTGALMSYEQAVMLPAVLLVLGVWQHRKIPKGLILGIVTEIAGYLALRAALLPQSTSRYQNQQFRMGAGVWQSLSLSVGLPFTAGLRLYANAGSSWEVLLLGSTYVELIWLVIPFVFWAWAWRAGHLREVGLPLVAAAFAFAPMAFLKPFDHYYFWPMAVRVLFVLALARLLLHELGTRAGVTLQRVTPEPAGSEETESRPHHTESDPLRP